MLAQLMDLAAAVGSAPYADDPASLLRYERIAEEAQAALVGSAESESATHEFMDGSTSDDSRASGGNASRDSIHADRRRR
jgi:hypothetical protein